MNRAGRWIKRTMDIVGAAVLLVVTLPVMAVVAMAIWMRLGRPVFFVQQRPGLRGVLFGLVKFRTMIEANGDDGGSLPDEQRLTRFGRWLRATSLDELPELWNVLRGHMSLVGPRPLLTEYLPRYSPRQARRHEVRPGITGWAQVNGRNATGWDERLEMDVWYVDHQSVWLDLKILAETVTVALGRKGIHHDGHATMPKFGESGECDDHDGTSSPTNDG